MCLIVEAVKKGPQRLEWIIFRTESYFLSKSLNVDLMYFPKVHLICQVILREVSHYLLHNLEGTIMKIAKSSMPKFTKITTIHLHCLSD